VEPSQEINMWHWFIDFGIAALAALVGVWSYFSFFGT
jgi:hypothetical protein